MSKRNNKLKKLEPVVETALRENPITRVDDFVLYLSIIKNVIDTDMTIEGCLLNHTVLGLPPFESVTRCRRKLCEKYPELKNAAMEEIRSNVEQEYRAYAND